jgi:hypothetical protein
LTPAAAGRRARKRLFLKGLGQFGDGPNVAHRDTARHPFGGGKNRVDLLHKAATALDEIIIEKPARARADGRDDDPDRQIRRGLVGLFPRFVRSSKPLAQPSD